MKKIGIIVCGVGDIWGGEPGYGSFVEKRFTDHSDSETICFEQIHAVSGPLPAVDDIPTFTGFIITGSRYSVNENHPWIRRLEEFVTILYRITNHPKPRLFGICFGHQLIAKALGGQVRENANGKFIFGSVTMHVDNGLTHKKFFKDIFGESKTLNIMQAHSEEVRMPPENAESLGDSQACSCEILQYGNHILSMQGHPELHADEMKDIIMPQLREAGVLSERELSETLPSLADVDTDAMIRFVVHYLTQP